MKTSIYLVIGVIFGITMFKSEAASWFRIYEMFQFQSFHMYGIIGVALGLGLLMTYVIKRFNVKSFYGKTLQFKAKDSGFKRYLIGGTLFGLGWALAGACPGPMYTLIGSGYVSMIIVILAAVFGTYIYGRLKTKLPH
ncbi:MAG: transporter [Flavobacteriaceae bacterium]|uniref:DUF6691 family protein n=1 Tax=Bizionia echini TaxID=649333 RepID=UPI000C8F996F|nr:transporter [Flavobacteriaceae bacterium]